MNVHAMGTPILGSPLDKPKQALLTTHCSLICSGQYIYIDYIIGAIRRFWSTLSSVMLLSWALLNRGTHCTQTGTTPKITRVHSCLSPLTTNPTAKKKKKSRSTREENAELFSSKKKMKARARSGRGKKEGTLCDPGSELLLGGRGRE